MSWKVIKTDWQWEQEQRGSRMALGTLQKSSKVQREVLVTKTRMTAVGWREVRAGESH